MELWLIGHWWAQAHLGDRLQRKIHGDAACATDGRSGRFADSAYLIGIVFVWYRLFQSDVFALLVHFLVSLRAAFVDWVELAAAADPGVGVLLWCAHNQLFLRVDALLAQVIRLQRLSIILESVCQVALHALNDSDDVETG